MKIAQKVCGIDGLDENETKLIVKEVQAFNLSKEDCGEVLDLFKSMSLFRAIEIIKNADENVKKETASLCIVAMNEDDKLSDKEFGAYWMTKMICDLPDLNFTEAKEHLKL